VEKCGKMQRNKSSNKKEKEKDEKLV